MRRLIDEKVMKKKSGGVDEMKRASLLLYFCISFLLLTCTSLKAVTTYFPETHIGGGIYGTAEAEITSGSGYIDIIVRNTSSIGPVISPDGRANPFITEIEFVDITGFTFNESASYASSLSDTLFAQGAGNAAVHYAERNLYYRLVAPDTPGMDKCLMTENADNIRNDNTVGSANILDGSNIPQEGWAVGFLNTHPDIYSGTVFDAALFHFAYDETGTPDVSFYATQNTLVVKFVGGGDYSDHVANVPEPATMALFGLGSLMLLRRRKI